MTLDNHMMIFIFLEDKADETEYEKCRQKCYKNNW